MLKWHVTCSGPALSTAEWFQSLVGYSLLNGGQARGVRGEGLLEGTGDYDHLCTAVRGPEAQGGIHTPWLCMASKTARRMAAAATAPGSGWSSLAELM